MREWKECTSQLLLIDTRSTQICNDIAAAGRRRVFLQKLLYYSNFRIRSGTSHRCVESHFKTYNIDPIACTYRISLVAVYFIRLSSQYSDVRSSLNHEIFKYGLTYFTVEILCFGELRRSVMVYLVLGKHYFWLIVTTSVQLLTKSRAVWSGLRNNHRGAVNDFQKQRPPLNRNNLVWLRGFETNARIIIRVILHSFKGLIINHAAADGRYAFISL